MKRVFDGEHSFSGIYLNFNGRTNVEKELRKGEAK